GLTPKVTAVRNASNDGVTLTITPQTRDEKGNIVDGTPQVVEVKDGAKGDKGETGAQGLPGERGAQGIAGTNGKDGVDGKSPEVSTTENPDGSHTVTIKNPNGTTTSFVVKNGEKGDKGDQGAAGTNGKDGLTPKVTAVRNASNDGVILTITPQVRDEKGNIVDGTPQVVEVKDGAKGDKGDTGAQGLPGERGAQGIAGTNGKDGVDGKSPEVSTSENPDG
ncbi:collagen-flanked surface repeat-containing protein, partial [Aerococcus loyolae]